MFRNPDSATHGAPLLFNLGFLAALLMLLLGRSAVVALLGLSSRAVTCVGGYFRPKPDPWLEEALREAFAEIDRDLAAILHHEQAQR